MMWFIFSEVMFFAAFFGALFYARSLSVPWLGGEGTKVIGNELLHPLFENAWPTNGPAKLGPRDRRQRSRSSRRSACRRSTRIILLTSGVTVTIAHHALRAGKRGMLNVFLRADLRARASCSSTCRRRNTATRTRARACTLGTGIYGSTFFMLTGFHGFHVTLGAIMLCRASGCGRMNGHFTPQRHFAFEAVAWYWHFVGRGLVGPVHLRLLDLAGYIRDCEKGASGRPFLW